jgi:hypothetical protein
MGYENKYIQVSKILGIEYTIIQAGEAISSFVTVIIKN